MFRKSAIVAKLLEITPSKYLSFERKFNEDHFYAICVGV